MAKSLLILIASGFFFSLYTQGGKSLGVMIGEPTAFLGRFSLGGSEYLEGGIGISIIEEGFWLHVVYAHYFAGFFAENIPLYLGGGILLSSVEAEKKKALGLGPRAILGVEFFPRKYPFSVFLEASLHIIFVPEVGAGGGFAVGGRYWF